jgi:hypothetical protein
VSDLYCDHCGDIAFVSQDYRDGVYWFTDGDGEECRSCGYPGYVVVDEPDPDDADVRWATVDVDDKYCNDPTCESCAEARALRSPHDQPRPDSATAKEK